MVSCFFGHRTINETAELKSKLNEIIEKLILERQVDTFLFGSKSQFNSLCQETVAQIKEKYPHIKRVYVRAEYPVINDDYENYLLQSYEETYYPENLVGAGRAIYIKRNFEMIDKSNFCVAFFDKEKAAPKSGTRMAVNYAAKKGKKIINLFDLVSFSDV